MSRLRKRCAEITSVIGCTPSAACRCSASFVTVWDKARAPLFLEVGDQRLIMRGHQPANTSRHEKADQPPKQAAPFGLMGYFYAETVRRDLVLLSIGDDAVNARLPGD